MTEPARCPVCGASLVGRRRQTRYCSGKCRAEGSRLTRLAAGIPADGFETLADRLGRVSLRNRTYRVQSTSEARMVDAPTQRGRRPVARPRPHGQQESDS